MQYRKVEKARGTVSEVQLVQRLCTLRDAIRITAFDRTERGRGCWVADQCFGKLPENPDVPRRQLLTVFAGLPGDHGIRRERVQQVESLEAETEGCVAETPLELAQALAYVGEPDRAIDVLYSTLPASTLLLQTSFPHPLYQSLRDDPRWKTPMQDIGRAPEQMAAVSFSLDGARDRLGL